MRESAAAGMVRTRPWLAVAALTLTGVLVPMVLAPPASAAACPGSALSIVAHEDDDLIFINPDILNDIRAGRCVRTLFVTAGDAGNPYPDSIYRENAPEAAYAQMAGVADNWTTVDDGVAGREIQVRALVGRPNVTIAFLRLPDGFPVRVRLHRVQRSEPEQALDRGHPEHPNASTAPRPTRAPGSSTRSPR